jgi:hypothetical protein
MEKTSKERADEILVLLKEIPHPGAVFLKLFSETDFSKMKLRPKGIPEGDIKSVTHGVNLSLLVGSKAFYDGGKARLNFWKGGNWQEFIEEEDSFVIKKVDIGASLGSVKQREKNFNKRLIHLFLDQLALDLKVSNEDQERILDRLNYPFYFWEKACSVDGSASSTGDVLPIDLELTVTSDAISTEGLRLKYYSVPLSSHKYLKAVIECHKTLIELYHLIKGGEVNIPVDIEILRSNCWEKIRGAERNAE